MIPIRDTIPSRRYPVVNNGIIALNVMVFLLEMSYGSNLGQVFYYYGLVPSRFTSTALSPYFSTEPNYFSFISYMFLHAGFWHLLGNMWFLYIFGDNVEDRLGHFNYLLFYILSGILSGLSHLLINQYSTVPTVGASGAIAGVMGAYFILYPRAKILTLIPIIIIPYFIELPAFIFICIWLLMQFVNVAGSTGAGGVAWWAHIGGFFFGIVLLKFFKVLPELKFPEKFNNITIKNASPRLQVIRPYGSGDDFNLYGVIHLFPVEGVNGTRKLVNIPWGFQKMLYQVTIPPGTLEGTVLRLKGLGKIISNGQRGDLHLKVVFDND